MKHMMTTDTLQTDKDTLQPGVPVDIQMGPCNVHFYLAGSYRGKCPREKALKAVIAL